MTCPKPVAPVTKLPADLCLRLAMFEEALFILASGEKRAEVRHDTYFVRYHDGNVGYLEREVARLRAICGNRSAITIERTPIGYPTRGRY
jgi:hypothetical protein